MLYLSLKLHDMHTCVFVSGGPSYRVDEEGCAPPTDQPQGFHGEPSQCHTRSGGGGGRGWP